MSVCLELKGDPDADPRFMGKIITADESRVYGYDHGTKMQNSQWKTVVCVSGSPRPEQAC